MPDGPWVPSSHTPPSCNNPAPLRHPNGTLFLLCGSTTLYSSPSIDGPWPPGWTWSPESGGGPNGGYEDGFMWIDKRGSWHSLYHVWDMNDFENRTHCANSTVSAHAYSEDGLHWFVGELQPYNSTVTFADGRPAEISPTRERPKLFFDSDGVTPLYLFNGAVMKGEDETCAEPWCSSCKRTFKSYTLVVPLGHDGGEGAAKVSSSPK